MYDDFIDLITPKKINYKKIRLGPKEDGGYVISKCALDDCTCLFTYGVGNETRFEEEFTKKYKKPAYLFDHTIGKKNYKNELINFFNEGLGFQENCNTFFYHYNILNITGKVFLKIDIEGGEYEFFEKTDIFELSKLVSGISIEVHGLDSELLRNRYIAIAKKLKDFFVLNHVHGNNWGGYFYYKEYAVPTVLELTFINKNIAGEFTECQEIYPIKDLDYPNRIGFQDLDLCFINKNCIVDKYTPSTEKKMTRDVIHVGVGDYPTQNIKKVTLNKNYINPRFYPRKFPGCPDTFSVKYNGDSIDVQRTDCNLSWGLPLIIDVEFDYHEPIKSEKNLLIPKVIYQTFKTNVVPIGMYNAIKSWQDNNPDYEHYFFTDDDCIDFIEKNFDKKVLDAYLNFIPGAFKADLWRCCILYIKGGIYVDSDMVCLRSLNEVINEDDEFLSARDDPMSKSFIYNAFIACTPGHPFIKKQIDSILENAENKNMCYYLDVAGPALLGKSINKVCKRSENSEFELGPSNINGLKFRLLEHDWKSKTIKFNNKDFVLTEYYEKNKEMKERNIPSYYDLYQKNIVYQQIPRNIYFTTYDSVYINDYMIKSFETKNKFWKLNYYSDKDCLKFFKEENDNFKNILGVDVLSFFNSLENGGERSDFWRYCVIYLYGGVYTDADTYCNVSLDNWIKHHDLILGTEGLLPRSIAETFGIDQIGKIYGDTVVCVCNWAFAAKPRHEFFKNVILDIVNNPIKNNILLNTGPGRMTKHAMKYFNNEIAKLEVGDIANNHSILFNINRFGSNQSHSNSYINYQNPFETIDEAYIVHLFDGSWRVTRNKDIKKYKSNLGVSHNMTLKKQKDNTYIGVARLDKDTSSTQFLKKIGDCRSLLLLNFDKNLELINETEKFISGFDKEAKFEDYRIFNFRKKDFYSVSYIDHDFNTRVAILDEDFKFLGDVNIDRNLNRAWDKVWEKNWLFFENQEELYFIYSTTPRYVVYKCIDFNNLIFETFIDIEWPLEGPEDNLYFGNVVTTGGSTNPVFIEEKDFYLYLIHTKCYDKRKYNHYLVLLDKELKPIKFCKRPLINEHTKENLFFISSMIVEENYITISGGVNDSENFTWQLSKEFIFNKIINI